MFRYVVALGLLIFPASVFAEQGERIIVIVEPEAGQAGEELARVIGSYVSDFSLEPIPVEHHIPEGSFEEVREVVRSVALEQEAEFVVWTTPTHDGAMILSVMHIRGDTALVRTIDLADEPPPTLRRTVAAVVRSVVDTGFLEEAAQAEEAEGPPENVESSPSTEIEEPPSSSPAEEGPREPPTARLRMGVDLSYGFRWVSSPGPSYQAIALSTWIGALDWLGVLLTGRFGIPTDAANQLGGSTWRAACGAALGLERPIGILAVGAQVGVDMEWLTGHVELDGNRGQSELDAFSVGVLLRLSLRVRLWRGLELISAVETVLRPERTLFTVQGESAVSTGYVEVGLEIGLGWQIL